MVVCVIALAACTSASAPAGSDPSGRWDAGGVRFSAPVAWYLRTGGGTTGNGVLAFVSNQPMEACSEDPTPTCPPPMAQLTAGGVLIGWYATTCVASGCNLPAGGQLLVGGRVAVRYPSPGLCAELLATEVEVVAVTVSPQRVDLIVTCSRDESDETRAQIGQLFDSIQWRTP